MKSVFDAPGEKAPISAMKRILSTFLAGLAAVIPILGIVVILVFIYRLLRQIGEKMIDAVFKALNFLRGSAGIDSPWSFSFPGDEFVWMLIPVLLVYSVGFLAKGAQGRKLLNLFHQSMLRIPIIGFIYSALKQFVDSVRNLGGPRKFKSVAYIEYPSPGCRLLGFVTANFHDRQVGKDVTSVFIPTSPNPMTGFVVIVEDEKVFNSDLTLEEAGKLILSAGLVSPESYQDS